MLSMRRVFCAVLLIALFANASCQDNEKSGSGSNPDKDCGSGKSFRIDDKLPTDKRPLNKGDAAVDSKNKKPPSKREGKEDFRKSFLFVSTMFHSSQ